ncbi:hypothetical protein DL769_007607 [Monosporascus sp. CRB-8-3]|nr:hypothetical protein DL769_007607 [Monosporascus sp. CRB-8-3]
MLAAVNAPEHLRPEWYDPDVAREYADRQLERLDDLPDKIEQEDNEISRNCIYRIYAAAHEFNSIAQSRQMAAIRALPQEDRHHGWIHERSLSGLIGLVQAARDRWAKDAGRREGTDEGSCRPPPQNTAAPTVAGRPVAPPPSASSFNHIHLPGEEIDDVKVYGTCDEIRRKINEHLKIPGVAQAQFYRALYSQLRMPKTNGI